MEFQVTDKATPAGSKRSVTEQGFLLIRDCALSRAGVTEYSAANFQPRMYNDRDPNDVIRVYRSTETLAASAPAWYGAPLANEHPPEFLNADNTPKYQIGSVIGEPAMRGPILYADVLVTDSRGQADINAGKEELSNGYMSNYDFTPGTSPEGEPYDCEQLNLKPNHVALVVAGRCGAICKVSDSADPTPKEAPMGTVTVNGVTYECSEQLAQVIANLQSTIDTLTAQVAQAPAAQEAAVAEVTQVAEEAQAKVEELSQALEEATSPDAMDAAVEERTEVLDHARQLIPNFDHKGKSNAQIRREVVQAKFPDLPVKNLDSADYVRARFDGLTPTTPNKSNKAPDLNEALRQSLSIKNQDGADVPDVEKARAAAIERRNNQYKRK